MTNLQRFAFIEFDSVVLRGAKDYVAAASAVLSPLGGPAVDDIIYSRFFANRPKVSAVSAYLEYAGITEEAQPLAKDIMAKYRASLLERAGKEERRCAEFAAPLASRNIMVVWVTQIDEEPAREVLSSLVTDSSTVVYEPSQYVGGNSWENWRRLCRRFETVERLCTAIVGSGISAKGALAASLYAIACADPLALEQDFSGVDAYFEEFSDEIAPELLRVLWKA